MIAIEKLNEVPGRPQWLGVWEWKMGEHGELEPFAMEVDSPVKNPAHLIIVKEKAIAIYCQGLAAVMTLDLALYAARVEACVKRWQATPQYFVGQHIHPSRVEAIEQEYDDCTFDEDDEYSFTIEQGYPFAPELNFQEQYVLDHLDEAISENGGTSENGESLAIKWRDGAAEALQAFVAAYATTEWWSVGKSEEVTIKAQRDTEGNVCGWEEVIVI